MIKKKIFIKYITNVNELRFNNNIILAAFNLAFISFFFIKNIKLSKNLVVWPDGILAKRFFNCEKIPGNQLINKLMLNKKIKKIVVLGNANNKDIKLLQKLYRVKIQYYSLGVDIAKNLFNELPKIYKNCLYLITLPTPKQEQISDLIAKNYKFYKIICIGGGLSIASGNEKKCPYILYNSGLEFLWRLRGDTIRRVKRLILTFLIYLSLELTLFPKKIKFTKIKKFI
jgi:UDP-N-acetyl-D-mannosaminuronic acid transferase (WecB/TagA/CpsF family)